MMGETMDFPKTPQEFIEQYKFKDSQEVYTNGADLVPMFRVRQMIEHYIPADRCVCCGDVIPEGRQVCPGCEKEVLHNAH